MGLPMSQDPIDALRFDNSQLREALREQLLDARG